MPFKGPLLTSCVASRTTAIYGHRQACVAGRRGPTTLSTTFGANLDCAFEENALFQNFQTLRGRPLVISPKINENL